MTAAAAAAAAQGWRLAGFATNQTTRHKLLRRSRLPLGHGKASAATLQREFHLCRASGAAPRPYSSCDCPRSNSAVDVALRSLSGSLSWLAARQGLLAPIAVPC